VGKSSLIGEKIGSMLKRDTRGLTIQEIAEKTHVSRITASIALAKLEGSGMIEVRPIGNCKLHYWKKRGKA
jgi:Mn-dependent DtxR family transcriptional regulator